MRIQRWLTGLGGVACCSVVALTVSAVSGEEEKRVLTRAEQEAKARGEANARVIRQLTLANDLAEEGRKIKSPLCLISAAEVLRKITDEPRTVKAEPRVEGAKPPAGSDEKAEEPLSAWEQSDLLLADARSMADRQARDGTLTRAEADAVKTLARQVEGPKRRPITTRAARGGPQQRTGFLAPRTTHAYRIEFDGLTTEYVRVFGNGKTTLQLSVTNSRGVLRGVDSGANPGGTWVPGGPGGDVYTIRITNTGEVGTPYRMITN
jgi:hypothetical protein